jgi:hypothetical protein
VKQRVIAILSDALGLLLHEATEIRWSLYRGCQEINQRSCVADSIRGFAKQACVVKHDIPQHSPNVAPRIGVVTDVRNTFCGQVCAADFQQMAAHAGRYPGVDAMSDDVVELSEARVERLNVEVLQP